MKTLVLLCVLIFAPLVNAQSAVPCVNKYVTNPHITQHEFDAMVDFTFNVGCRAFSHSTLLKKVNAGDTAGAANEFMKWVYVGKTPVKGLSKRRTDERNLFLKPNPLTGK